MIAFVFELNKLDNSAGSNFQSAEEVTPSFFVCGHAVTNKNSGFPTTVDLVDWSTRRVWLTSKSWSVEFHNVVLSPFYP